ncbi:hypothetical protein AGMMS49921_07370 [Endomicrobiia bacterium]|nr:hypothetical protein AGMMS49921_07280 [Endomicrobiia bacterium]GHT42370.1 hypothetical protein AGMMS49921_07370 [Endomicrobiia bacterium]
MSPSTNVIFAPSDIKSKCLAFLAKAFVPVVDKASSISKDDIGFVLNPPEKLYSQSFADLEF